ncbi:FAD-dependent 5-carboxymethylaminomethyl-2-thiouridine(34) oxidoreductase MnmC [Moraxella sp.]|uniref:FAD-dependent 5-carboxymethylaminomethyl-2-thiouridine(34) oxidoreductase MnmC n=1 Tax=Moraxella sp. TaxID=479 RepID=UPI0026DCF836|nr:FAD-dependent 5-carboxymethylaminomethyl-2-thiouridine(34) oxidoreductase MnmC [Moraxella sp.]MDO4895455.1 FAD-dependent 5-carboxymethylaminomethyl-2-thiouridine(34) oxidoreductase MnmC [Moraxella sp.]
MNHIEQAIIDWQSDAQGHLVPTSPIFDDVYFSKAGGLDETHHVFLAGNDLPNRFANLPSGSRFVIAETGFGTGLNFLATCLLWQQTAPKDAHLHFISTEKFPLSKSDLSTALFTWRNDDTSVWIDALLDNYPLPMMGCHRLHISEQITLDLWYGDAKQSLTTLLETQTMLGRVGGVMAWFLDGFSPSKNSDLWSDELFELIAKLCHHQATLATFTAAGFVRRGLMAAGFLVKKTKGFGFKREMLTATIHQDTPPSLTQQHPKHIAIVGAGISGVMLADALAKRGHHITLIDQNPPMSGASGNPRALFAPKLSLIQTAHQHLSTVGFLYAWRVYRHLNTDQSVFEETGVIDFLLPSQKSAQKRAEQIAPYPDELIHQIDTHLYPTAEIICHVPMGGLLSPANIYQAIKKQPNIHFVQTAINHINTDDQQAHLVSQTHHITADHVVICAGFLSDALSDELFVCRKIRGQLSWVAMNDEHHQLPSTPIKYDGYCGQFYKDNQTHLLFGASFVRNSTDDGVYDEEHQFNQDKLTNALPEIAKQISHQPLFGKAGIRAQTPDYHPIVGMIGDDDKRYAMYGMGSKGFCFAPLCSQILADIITGGILPIDAELLKKISPNRPRLQTPLTAD